MARSSSSFQKRQKELARLERQRDKAARKAERKQTAKQRPAGDDSDIAWDEATALPPSEREPE